MFPSCCVLMLERMSCSILRHLNSERNLGLLPSWFILSCKTVLSPDQLIFQDWKGFQSEMSAGTLVVREPFGEVLNVKSPCECSLKRYWIWQWSSPNTLMCPNLLPAPMIKVSSSTFVQFFVFFFWICATTCITKMMQAKINLFWGGNSSQQLLSNYTFSL